MKPTTETAWLALARTARGDRPPAREIDPLLHTLAQARAARPPTLSLADAFADVFAAPRALAALVAVSVGSFALALWQGWTAWHQLAPWFDLIANTVGGAT